MIRLLQIVIALLVIPIVWTVCFLWALLEAASGDEEKPLRVGPTTGSWPYRWLW